MSIVLMIPAVQTSIVRVVTNKLSNDINAEISIDRVSAFPFMGVRLHDFKIEDQQQETLFYANQVHARIDYFSIRKKHLYLGDVQFFSPRFNLYETEEENMNFSFLLDSLSASPKKESSWDYSFRQLIVLRGDIDLKMEKSDAVLPDDFLSVDDLNFRVNRLTPAGDSLKFEISELSFSEERGLHLNELRTRGYIGSDRLELERLTFNTDNSLFDFGKIKIPFRKYDSEGEPCEFRTEVNRLVIDASEAMLFYPGIPKVEAPFVFSGTLFGTYDSFRGRSVSCTFGSSTRLVSNFDVTGLSNPSDAFLYLDFEDFYTTVSDVDRFIPEEEHLFPQSFNELGVVKYSGSVTGFFTDLVAYGAFTSQLGSLSTDIRVSLREDNSFSFSGLLSSREFDLGSLAGFDQMGDVTFDMEVNGSRNAVDDYHIVLDGIVTAIDFYDYIYENIELKGTLTHYMFDGLVRIDDENGQVDFNGLVDMSGKVPKFDFSASLRNIMPDRLNLYPVMEGGVFSVKMESNFEGDNVDDLVGELLFTDGVLYSPGAMLDFDTVRVSSVRENGAKTLKLESPFADGTVAGRYLFTDFDNTLAEFASHFLPSITIREPLRDVSAMNDFEFDIRLKEMSNLVSALSNSLELSNRGYLKGHFDAANQRVDLDVAFDYMGYKSVYSEDFHLYVNSQNGDDDLSVVLRSGKTEIGRFVDLYNLSVHQKANSDTLTTNLFWNNWDAVTYSGALYSTTTFTRDENNNRRSDLAIHPSSIIVADSIWDISESHFSFYKEGLSAQNFRVENAGQYVALEGFLDREKEDALTLMFNHLDVNRMFESREEDDISFGGTINGELVLEDYYRTPLLSSSLEVESFMFNEVLYGTLSASSRWNNDLDALMVHTRITDQEDENLVPVTGFGLVYPEEQLVDFDFEVTGLDLGFLNVFLDNVIQNLQGDAHGRIYYRGHFGDANLTGRVAIDDGTFDVDLLQTSYSISDTVSFYPNEIRFRDLTVVDRNNRRGVFTGSVFHDGKFSDMIYDLRLDANNMLLLNTSFAHNPYYYGTVYGSGTMNIGGNSDNVDIAVNARTNANTRFFIPVESRETALESDFIRFTASSADDYISAVESLQFEPQEYTVDLTGMHLNMDIEVTPDARIQMIFDERIGDVLRATGMGNVQIAIDRQGNIRFFGDYTIAGGEYHFSLQNLINKRFLLQEGGTVAWQGDPYNAEIDIEAIHQLRASIRELTGPMQGADQSESGYGRIQINVLLSLTGMLEQPVIGLGLEMPTLEEGREALILDYISSEEEMNRQVLSLLVLNRFYTPEHMRMSESASARGENTALVTTSEVLSSQLSRWLTSISSDVDVGFAYRPGDNITSEEFELALSTQVFNDRVTLNGNVGYGKYQTNTSKMVGDFDMDVKLNRTGTLRARAYTRSNEDLLYETSPTTQGVGFSFKEEFNTFRELAKKYWRIVTFRRDEDEE
ncbi:translocation/assembly module TamB domain-containing protein [Marinilabiliaceae bacterium ANBcel2]|nr:translocation/assembly module TamB domain-containing protein [Marinilabiliaceae bacterium ANBcel2]